MKRVMNLNLYEYRFEAILNVLKPYKLKKIIDFGCGDGKLIQYLYKNGIFETLACVEISKKRIKKLVNIFSENNIVTIFEQSFLEYNESFKGYDGAILSEVIEHLTEKEIHTILNLILNSYSPKLLIITTPNKTFNENLKILHNGLRHSSHIFELSVDDAEKFVQHLKIKYPQYNILRRYCDPQKATHLIIIEKKE